MPSTGSLPSGSRSKVQLRSSWVGPGVPSEIDVLEAEQAAHDDRPVRPRAGPGGDQPVAAGLDRPQLALDRAVLGDPRVAGDPVGDVGGVALELLAAVHVRRAVVVAHGAIGVRGGCSTNLQTIVCKQMFAKISVRFVDITSITPSPRRTQGPGPPGPAADARPAPRWRAPPPRPRWRRGSGSTPAPRRTTCASSPSTASSSRTPSAATAATAGGGPRTSRPTPARRAADDPAEEPRDPRRLPAVGRRAATPSSCSAPSRSGCSLPDEWRDATAFSDWVIRLTPTRARALIEALDAVDRGHAEEDDDDDEAPATFVCSSRLSRARDGLSVSIRERADARSTAG